MIHHWLLESPQFQSYEMWGKCILHNQQDTVDLLAIEKEGVNATRQLNNKD